MLYKELEQEKASELKAALIKELSKKGYLSAAVFVEFLRSHGIENLRIYAKRPGDFVIKYLNPEICWEVNRTINDEKMTGLAILNDRREELLGRDLTPDIDPDRLRQIRDYLMNWLGSHKYFDCVYFPSACAICGVANFRIYARRVSLFLQKYFGREFEVKYDYVDSETGRKCASVIVLGTGKSNLSGGAELEKDVELIGEILDKMAAKHDGYVDCAELNTELNHRGILGAAKEGLISSAFLEKYFGAKYERFTKYSTADGEMKKKVIVRLERIERDFPESVDEETLKNMKERIQNELDERKYIPHSLLLFLLQSYGFDFKKYAPSLKYFVEKYLTPEFKSYQYLIIGGKRIPNVLVSSSQNMSMLAEKLDEDLIEVEAAAETVKKESQLYTAAELSEEMIAKIKTRLKELLLDKSYLITNTFKVFIREFGIEDFHKYASTVAEFTEKYLAPEFIYQKAAILPDDERVTVIVPVERAFLTDETLAKIREEIARTIERDGYYAEAVFPMALDKYGVKDFRIYAVKVSKFVQRFFAPEFKHESFITTKDGKTVAGVIVKATKKQIEEATETEDGTRALSIIENFRLLKTKTKSVVYGGLLPLLPKEEQENLKGLYGTTNNFNGNVQMNMNISTAIGAIASGVTGQELIDALNKLPSMRDYLPSGNALTDVIEGEAEEVVMMASDRLVDDMKAGMIEAKVDNKFDICEVLGIDRALYVRIASKIDERFNEELYFAARLDAMLAPLEKDSSISNESKDYSPITIMYCKLVERMLKSLHSDIFAKRLPDYRIKVKVGETSCRFADVLGVDGPLVRSRLTMGSFLTAIESNGTSNQIALAKSDDPRIYGKWHNYAVNVLAPVKDVRDKSAHGDKNNMVDKVDLDELKNILFKLGGIETIVDLAKN